MSTRLSDYFVGIAGKRLGHVEIFSNQHELNGVTKFRTLLGEDKANFNGAAIYLPDEEEHVVENESSYTWYNVRANNPNRSAEYRLYFSISTPLIQILIAKQHYKLLQYDKML